MATRTAARNLQQRLTSLGHERELIQREADALHRERVSAAIIFAAKFRGFACKRRDRFTMSPVVAVLVRPRRRPNCVDFVVFAGEVNLMSMQQLLHLELEFSKFRSCSRVSYVGYIGFRVVQPPDGTTQSMSCRSRVDGFPANDENQIDVAAAATAAAAADIKRLTMSLPKTSQTIDSCGYVSIDLLE
jgi:hypothetical protein